MHILVLGEENIIEEFKKKPLAPEIQVMYKDNLSETGMKNINATFILTDEITADLKKINNTEVFFASTINTLKEQQLPANFHRINGWKSFISRDSWEIATNNEAAVTTIFNSLGWKYITVADEPGLVSARIISMIINEAFYALGENVSTKEEIDIAMKLGTNYPYGPFEWSQLIGLENIYNLLEKLSKTDSRYTVAPALKSEIS